VTDEAKALVEPRDEMDFVGNERVGFGEARAEKQESRGLV
jgi:hypothetical protein